MFRYIALPLMSLLFLFSPVFSGRIPLNTDWLASRFPPFFRGTGVPVINPDMDDPVIQIYPLASHAAGIWRRGMLPLWNDGLCCGLPLAGDTHSKPFDPLFFLIFSLPFNDPLRWTALIFAQFALLAFVCAGFLRSRGLRPLAVNLTVTSLIFSGFCVTWSLMRLYLPALICLFAGFWIISSRSGPSSHRAWLTLPLAALFWSSHPQYGAYSFILILIYDACQFRSARVIKGLFIRAASFFYPYVLGMLAGSPSLLPELEMIANSARLGKNYFSGIFTFQLAPLLNLLHPSVFGHPATGDYSGIQVFGRSYTNTPVIYAGLGILIFSFYAALRKLPASRFFTGISLCMIAGLELLNLQLLKSVADRFLPFVFAVDPARISGMFIPLLVLPAASGLDYFIDRSRARSGASSRDNLPVLLAGTLALGIVLACLLYQLIGFLSPAFGTTPGIDGFFTVKQYEYRTLLLYPPIRQCLLTLFLYCLVLHALESIPKKKNLYLMGLICLWGWELIPNAVRSIPFSPASYLDYADVFPDKKELQNYRVCGIDSMLTTHFAGDVLPPNTSLLPGMKDFEGYVSMPFDRYMHYLKLMNMSRPYYSQRFTVFESPWLDAASVKYIFTAMERVNHSYTEPTYLHHLFRYTNEKAFPKAWFIRSIYGIDHWDDIPAVFQAKMVDLHESAFMLSEETHRIHDMNAFQSGSLEFLESGLHRSRWRCALPSEGFLVVNDANYPGWRFRIDGSVVPSFHVDVLFHGCIVPAGNHVIEREYFPLSYYLGAFLFCIALLALAIVYSLVVGL